MPNLTQYSVTNAKSELEAMLHGTTLDQISNIYGVFNRAARQVLLDLDPQETKRAFLTNPIFNGVFDYSNISDLKGDKIIDIRPQVSRQLTDNFVQKYSKQFDLKKDFTLQPQFIVDFDSGNRSIRINYANRNQSILINNADSLTGNGTWAASGNASSLAQDTVNFASGGASLSFNLAAVAGTGILTNSTFGASDLTAHLNLSTLFMWVYMPTGSAFTSVELRWGSSSANYWTSTATQTFEGNAFNNGWNLLSFNWSSATKVGNPVVSTTNYLQTILTYNGTLQTGARINGIYSRLGIVMDILYYSKYLFRDATTGTFQETVTDDSNFINLDTETMNVFLYQLAVQTFQQQGGMNSPTDMNYYQGLYTEALRRYRKSYKSEVQIPTSTYYEMPRKGFGGFIGKVY